jgi:hypothetical protein
MTRGAAGEVVMGQVTGGVTMGEVTMGGVTTGGVPMGRMTGGGIMTEGGAVTGGTIVTAGGVMRCDGPPISVTRVATPDDDECTEKDGPSVASEGTIVAADEGKVDLVTGGSFIGSERSCWGRGE